MSCGDSGIMKNKAKKTESDALERVLEKGWSTLWEMEEPAADSTCSPQGAQSFEGKKDYQPWTPENNNTSVELYGAGNSQEDWPSALDWTYQGKLLRDKVNLAAIWRMNKIWKDNKEEEIPHERKRWVKTKNVKGPLWSRQRMRRNWVPTEKACSGKKEVWLCLNRWGLIRLGKKH